MKVPRPRAPTTKTWAALEVIRIPADKRPAISASFLTPSDASTPGSSRWTDSIRRSFGDERVAASAVLWALMPLPTENASLLHLHGPDLAQIAANIAASPAPLDDVVRTLRAHALAAAESFSELLCLPTLREVETLPYQAGAEERLFQIADSGALRPETKSSKQAVRALDDGGPAGISFARVTVTATRSEFTRHSRS